MMIGTRRSGFLAFLYISRPKENPIPAIAEPPRILADDFMSLDAII
jgi:hypothetical protein